MAVAVGAMFTAFAGPGVPVAAAAVGDPPVLKNELAASGEVSKAAGAGYLPSGGGASASGAFTQSVSLDVPGGRAGMAPALSLEYSSAGDGNGPVGVGWALAGASSQITRCPRTQALDGLTAGISFSQADRFCLDGQRLVQVGVLPGNTDNVYGADKTEYRTASNSFEKIGAFGGSKDRGPAEFTVTSKQGVTRTYKARYGSRNVQGVGFDSSNKAIVATDSTDSRRIVWTLDAESDRAGNTVTYVYDTAAAARNEFLVSEIDYTGFGTAEAPKRHVDFTYEPDSAGSWSTYQAGVRYEHTQRLKTVSMFAPDPAATQLVRQYNLSYIVSNTHRSLLSSVEECGPLGGCLKKKKFNWNNPSAVPSFTPVGAGTAVLDTASPVAPAMRVGDLDGDGKDDLLYSRGGGTGLTNPDQLRFGKSLTSVVNLDNTKGWTPLVGAITDIRSSRVMDADGDGRSDVLVATDRSTDPGFPHSFSAQLKKWDAASGKFVTMSSPFSLKDTRAGNFADVNGDGKLDFISFDGGTASAPKMAVRMGNGDGSFQDPQVTNADARCDLGVSDVNGDGRTEQLAAQWTGVDCSTDVYALRDNDGFGSMTTASQDFGQAGKTFHKATLNQTGYKSFSGDFNGDGLTDVLMLPPKTTSTIPDLSGVVLFNTGAGLAAPHTVVIPHDKFTDVRIADVNGDGRDDVVSFAASTNISISNGNGTFTSADVWGSGGTAHDTAGRTTSQLGDFNGDGRVDIVMVSQGGLNVLQQNERFTDTLSSVQDEGVAWHRQDVTYSNQWTSHPEAMGDYTCAFPLVCPKHGMTVVRKVTSREHQVNTTAPSAARVLETSYEDPVMDVTGAGSLGFGSFTQWDVQRPTETVTTFAHRKSVMVGGARIYPEAGRPATVRTATPIMTPGQGSNPPNWPSRISLTTHTYQTLSQHSGKVSSVFDHTQDTKQWEQSTGITWGALSADSPNEHITGISVPATPARHTTQTSELSKDDYGNVTSTSRITGGGTQEFAQTDYDTSQAAVDAWRVGEATQTRTYSTAADGTTHGQRSVDYHHNAQGLIDTVTSEKASTDDRIGQTVSYQYNDHAVLTKVTTSAKNRPPVVEHIEYTLPGGQPAFPGEPNEQIWPVQTWREHNETASRPSVWTLTHPAYGATLGSEDINGRRTLTKIDDLGRPVAVTADGQDPTTISYADRPDSGGTNGTVTTITSGPQTTTSSQDVTGRPLTAVVTGFDGLPVTTKTSYDVLGRTVASAVPSPSGGANTTHYVYDSLDRLTQITDPDGKKSDHTYTFDTDTATDAEGRTAKVTYDVNGRMVTSTAFTSTGTSGTPVTTSYHYAPFDLLDKITDNKNNVTSMTYDVLGRRTALVDPDKGKTTTSYFGDGLIDTETHLHTDGTPGNTTAFDYDDLGRKTRSTTEDGASTFVWDTAPGGIGQLASATSPDAITTSYHFDNLGRPVRTDLSDDTNHTTYTTSTTYNTHGQPATLAYPDAAGHRFTLGYGYNPAGYPDTVSDITAGQTAAKDLWKVTDRKANMALGTAVMGAGTAAITLTDSYEAASGRLHNTTAVNATDAGTAGRTLLDLTYGYDDTGLVTTRKEADDYTQRSETYGYDGLDRLKTWDLTTPASTTPATTTYGYDTLGNLTNADRTDSLGTVTSTRTYGQANGTQPHTLTGITNTCPNSRTCPGSDHPVYDDRGRQMAGHDRATVTYTAFDLPKTIVMKNGAKTTYRYDAFGVRVQETGPTGTTFIVPGLYEKRTTPSGAVTHVYYLKGTDGIIGQAVYDGTTTTIQYHLTDHLGSITATTKTSTTGAATRDQSLFYDPYGKPITSPGLPTTPTSDTTHGYTGHEMNTDLGTINMNGRLYDPTENRFLTPDPLI
ncbi:FG-GAP-like repeat-containing protein, partial [Streptomyces sp. NPDC005574]|uniref:FG-GAP-like repeat-containing protein n=1 Tax=Streptomyces sp. NPDC005574 TaxID=3156891 RepID=UPI0033A6986F